MVQTYIPTLRKSQAPSTHSNGMESFKSGLRSDLATKLTRNFFRKYPIDQACSTAEAIKC